MLNIFSVPDVFAVYDQNDFEKIRACEQLSTPSSEHGLKHPNVQKIIHSKDLHFDLVVTEDFWHESWLMFAYKFNAPIVTIGK